MIFYSSSTFKNTVDMIFLIIVYYFVKKLKIFSIELLTIFFINTIITMIINITDLEFFTYLLNYECKLLKSVQHTLKFKLHTLSLGSLKIGSDVFE